MGMLDTVKRGQMTLEAGVGAAIMVVVLAIAVMIGATILTGMQTGQPTAGYAINISNQGLGGLVNLSGQLGNVGTVIAAALILTILITGLGFLVFRKQ